MIQEYEDVIKQCNDEYKALLYSDEYVLGFRIITLLNAIKRFDIKKIIKLKRDNKIYHKVCKRYVDVTENNNDAIKCSTGFKSINSEDCGSSITIYSCIIGRYDLPHLPLVHYPNYRYVLFSDQRFDSNMGWEIRDLPDIPYSDPSQINRYIKFHPDEFFDTDYSFYMDGNVRIMTGLSDFLKLSETYYGIGMFNHYQRKCAFHEADACILLKKGNKENIQNEMKQYRKEGFPEMFGLKEATVIGADLRNDHALSLLHSWWEEYILWKSGRDQLSLPYVVWKDGHSISDIYNMGKDIRKDPHFQFYMHL